MRPVCVYIWVFADSMAFDLDTRCLLVLHVTRRKSKSTRYFELGNSLRRLSL